MIAAVQQKNHISVTTLPNNGRVLSYLIPGIELTLKSIRDETEQMTKLPGFRFLILTNNRERAHMIHEQVQKLISVSYGSMLSSAVVTGGQSMEKEINHLDFKQPEIVVGTVGRIKAHLKNSNYFDNLKLVVVDNAESFDERSQKDMKTIFEQLPRERCTLAMNVVKSSSSSSSPSSLSENQLNAIIFPNAEPELTIANLSDRALKPSTSAVKYGAVKCNDAREYIGKLTKFLEQRRSKKVAIFTQSSVTVEFLVNALSNNGIYAYPVHNKQAPSLRRSLINEFSASTNGILVGDRVIEDALQQTLLDTVIIAEGSPVANRELLSSRLKATSDSEYVTFQISPLVTETDDSSDVKPLDVECGDLSSVKPASEPLAQSLFSALLLKHKDNGSVDREQLVDSIVSFVQQAGAAQPTVSLATAQKTGVESVLKSKNLVRAL